MKKAKIIVHCLVENEGRFIWYAVNSVLPYVDKILFWDMSSTDGTWEIVNGIKSNKIEYKRVPAATSPNDLTIFRQQMLDITPKDYTWVMILDGDEIWPEDSIKSVADFAKVHTEFESIVVKTNNLVGDIFHRLPESSGNYQIAGRKGHLALRLINLKEVKGLHVSRPHGTQGYFDDKNTLVQNRDISKIKFFDLSYHHATHLHRSLNRGGDLLVPKRRQKKKFEIGESIPQSKIPTIFYSKERPSEVPDVTSPAPLYFWLVSLIFAIPRRLKHLLLPTKVGY